MAQQGPGGYGGGGPYGPPGGGGYGPPQGGGYPPAGGPPGGYGPPGAGGGFPAGHAPVRGFPYPGAPPGPPTKKSKTPLLIALGCLGLLLLCAVAAVFIVLAVKHRASAALSDAERSLAELAAGGASAVPMPGSTGSRATLTASASCQKAIACCTAIALKTAGGNLDLVSQGCRGMAALSDAVCVQQYEAQKRAASLLGTHCD